MAKNAPKRNRRPISPRNQVRPQLITPRLEDKDNSSALIDLDELGQFGSIDATAFELKFGNTVHAITSCFLEVDGLSIVVGFAAATDGTVISLRLLPWWEGVRTPQGGYLAPAEFVWLGVA